MSDANNDDPLSSIHGFFMLGKDSLLLYHSSRFHMPAHAFQMILTASLPEEAMNAYRADMERHPNGDTVWLLHNKNVKFALQQIYDGQIKSFQTDIMRSINGKYPSDPYVIQNVELKIHQTLYFRQFHSYDDYQRGQDSPYIAFSSNGSEVFLSHYLTRDPDYDLLARMSWTNFETMPSVSSPYAIPCSIRTGHTDGPSKPESCPLVAGNRYLRPDDEDNIRPSDNLGPHHGSPHKSPPTPSVGVNSIYWYDPTTINDRP